MNFPVYLELGGLKLHPHIIGDLVAYAISFQLYLFLHRKRVFPQASPPFEQMMWVIVGATFGALAGSKLLAWIESPGEYFRAPVSAVKLLGGKTIVGGLLGGWAGVEVAKWCVGIRTSTGDACVFPLIAGMSVGRVGCFLTGLSDHTHGVHTEAPWGVDFGDGRRHPTQLYEIGFLLALGIVLAASYRISRPRNGVLFRTFMAGYLAFRFTIEFLKPVETPYAGLSAIQWASAAGVGWCLWSLFRMRSSA